MIVVKLELWPMGDESRKQDLGKAHIVNVGGTLEIGEYTVKLLKGAKYSPNSAGGVWRKGEVKNFRRLTESPWALLARALAACGVR